MVVFIKKISSLVAALALLLSVVWLLPHLAERFDGGAVVERPALIKPARAAPMDPIANAGQDRSGTVGETVALSAVGSLNKANKVLGYAWSVLSLPGGSTVKRSSGVPTASLRLSMLPRSS